MVREKERLLKQSEELFSRGIGLNPQYPQGYMYLGNTMQLLRRDDEAEVPILAYVISAIRLSTLPALLILPSLGTVCVSHQPRLR
jgi:hypothetical protein